LVVDVKVVLDDPTLSELQMPALFGADRGHDPRWFPGLENDHHLIRLGSLKVGIHKVITPSRGRFEDRRTPFLSPVLHPILKLLGDIAQPVASDPLALAIGIKETDHSLGLLERLNQSV
jgi:hypothetical protein